MTVTHKRNIDLNHRCIIQPLEVMQDDRYSQNLEYSITMDGQPWQIPDDVTVLIRYVKADGTGGTYDLLPDGSDGFVISGNTVTIALAPQVCSTPGVTRLTVTLMEEESRLNIFSTDILVHRNPGLEIISEDYVKVFGMLAEGGWEPNMYLGTDANGNVIVRDFEKIELPGIVEAIERIIAIQEELMGG